MSLSIGMLGVGAWGAALAHVVRSAGHAVHVWSRGSTLEPLRGSQGLIMAVPAQALREILSGLKSIVTNSGKGLPLIIGAKGIEQGTGLFKNEVVAEVLPGADHFFHRRLTLLKRLVVAHLVAAPLLGSVSGLEPAELAAD